MTSYSDCVIRTFSGVAYVLSIQLRDNAGGLVFLSISRFTYGITLNSFAIPTAWAGVYLPAEDKAAKVALLNGLVAIGIHIGPPFDSMLAANILPGRMLGFESTGYATVIISSLVLVALLKSSLPMWLFFGGYSLIAGLGMPKLIGYFNWMQLALILFLIALATLLVPVQYGNLSGSSSVTRVGVFGTQRPFSEEQPRF